MADRQQAETEVTPPPRLSKRRQSFVDAYLACGVMTKAAIEAGYSKRSAYNSGSRLMKNDDVLLAIAIGQAEERNRLIMDRDELSRLCTEILRGKTQEFFREDGTIDIHNVDHPAALASVETETLGGDLGGVASKIKLAPKAPFMRIIMDLGGYRSPRTHMVAAAVRALGAEVDDLETGVRGRRIDREMTKRIEAYRRLRHSRGDETYWESNDDEKDSKAGTGGSARPPGSVLGEA